MLAFGMSPSVAGVTNLRNADYGSVGLLEMILSLQLYWRSDEYENPPRTLHITHVPPPFLCFQSPVSPLTGEPKRTACLSANIAASCEDFQKQTALRQYANLHDR